MLNASEAWARNDRAMIRRMCRVTTKYKVSSQYLLEGMQLVKVLHTRRLRWHGRVERRDG